MAEATCTAAGLVTAGQCFTSQVFDRKQQLSIIAYLMWKWADSAAALTTYANWDAVVLASKCIEAGLSDDSLIAATIGILNRGADGNGSIAFNVEIPVLTSSTASTAIACIQKSDLQTIKASIVFNLCRVFSELTS